MITADSKKNKISLKYDFIDSVIYQNLLLEEYEDFLIFPNSSILTRSQCEKLKNAGIIKKENFFEYASYYFKDSFIVNEKRPHMIVMPDGSFTNLDNLTYSDTIITHLNKKGLNIHLWESIIFSYDKSVKDLNWPIIFDKTKSLEKQYEQYKHIIEGFENTDQIKKDLYCFEFEKINNFIKRNNLTNVTVCILEGINPEFFKDMYNFTLSNKAIATSCLINSTEKLLTPNDYVEGKTIPSKSLIKNKFISLNLRYHSMRHMIVSYLFDKSSVLSFNNKLVDFADFPEEFYNNQNKGYWDNISNRTWFDFSTWKINYPTVYSTIVSNADKIKNQGGSLTLDQDFSKRDTNLLKDVPFTETAYHSCFCAVVTESFYAIPFPHYADKALNAIKCFRPFVLAAPAYSLEYLKQCGVKTFDDYWDESYDHETNHAERLIKIFKVIDYIDSLTLDELKDMYVDMQPILEHNYQIIKTLRTQDWIKDYE